MELQISWPDLLLMALLCLGTTPKSPFLSPFELMYGRHYLFYPLPDLLNPLSNYYPTLSLMRRLHEYPDSSILEPISHTSIAYQASPGDWVYLQNSNPKPLQPTWMGPHLVILTTPMAAKLTEIPTWIHLTKLKHYPRDPTGPSEDSPSNPDSSSHSSPR